MCWLLLVTAGCVCWAAPESGRESDTDWDQDSYYTGPGAGLACSCVRHWPGHGTPGSRDQDHRGGGAVCGGCLPTRGARSVAAGQGHVCAGAAVLCAQLRLTRYYRTALRTAALSFGVTLGAGWPGRPPPVLEPQTNLREL